MEESRTADDRGTAFWVELTEGDAVDIASGFVPNAVKATVLRLLDYRREDERRAERPVKPVRQKKAKAR